MIITTQLQQQQQDKYMKNKFPKLQQNTDFLFSLNADRCGWLSRFGRSKSLKNWQGYSQLMAVFLKRIRTQNRP